jgi:hypothetical protein
MCILNASRKAQEVMIKSLGKRRYFFACHDQEEAGAVLDA